MGRFRLGFVVVLVVLAGCSGNVALTDDTDLSETPTVTEPAPSSLPSTTATYRGTVTNVVDGDTIDVRLQNGTEIRIRLLGVDTPEVHTENEPEEFPGVPDTERGVDCLRDAGEDAGEFARAQLLGNEVRVVFDERADRRDVYGRWLAYVVVEGDNFNYRLVSEGHARVYESEFTQLEQFETASDEARTNGSGLWRCRYVGTETATRTADGSSGEPLVVHEIHADADGNDHENLDDEYVVFQNAGDEPLDLTGWSLRDDADHVYHFPDGFVIESGATVTVYTGSGRDTDSELYWGADGAIWNNAGDTVIVTNDRGGLVIEYEY